MAATLDPPRTHDPLLELDAFELEELVTACHDREELAGAEGRRRLRHARHALELELARRLAP